MASMPMNREFAEVRAPLTPALSRGERGKSSARLMRVFFGLSVLLTSAATTNATQLTQQDIFVGGQGGYHTYRIPSLIVTKKGTVLAFCEGRKKSGSDTGDIDLLLKRSWDGGKTWGNQQVVWDDGTNTCGNPCPVVDDETGIIWLLATHNPGGATEKEITSKKSNGARTVWLLKSKDDGKNWSAPVNITESVKDTNWNWYATGPGIGIEIQQGRHRGRLVVPCDHSSGGDTGAEQGSHAIYSDDHGRTWNPGEAVRPKMNECQVVELADGKGTLLLSMRNYLKEGRRAHSISQDGGVTWTAPEPDPALADPVCQASILRYNWPGPGVCGRILFSNPTSIHREKMTVRISYDDGKSWPVSKLLYSGPSAYSCLTELPDRTISCLYERGNTNAYEKITFAQFPIAWLEGD